jgi:hypothetical protein
MTCLKYKALPGSSAHWDFIESLAWGYLSFEHHPQIKLCGYKSF